MVGFVDCVSNQMKSFLEKQSEKSRPAIEAAYNKRISDVKKYIENLDPSDPDLDIKAQRAYEQAKFNIRRETKALVKTYKVNEQIKNSLLKESYDGKVNIRENMLVLFDDMGRQETIHKMKYKQYFEGVELKDVKQLNTKNFFDELEGINTGDKKAQEFAAAVKKYQDDVFNEKNNLGVYTEKKQGYGGKHRYNIEQLEAVGKDSFIKDNLDNGYIAIRETSRSTNEVLSDIYDYLIGKRDNIPGIGDIILDKKGSLFSKVSASRDLEFNPGKYSLFNDKYGYNALEYIVKDIQDNSKKLSELKTLGPNPEVGIKEISKTLRDNTNNQEYLSMNKEANDIYNYFSNPSGDISKLAAGLHSVRKYVSSVIMQGGVIANFFGDNALQGVKSMANGSGFFNGLSNALSSYGGKKATKLGKYLGLINDKNWLDALDDIKGLGFTNLGKNKLDTVSDWLWKINLIDAHTKRQEAGHALTFWGDLSMNKEMSFSEFNAKSNNLLKNNEITESDWNIFRNSEGIDIEGEKFITSKDIKNNDVADKFEKFWLREKDRTVISSTLTGRKAVSAGQMSGSLSGEAIMTLTQFWQWSHGYYRSFRDLYLNNSMKTVNKIGFLGASIGALTVAAYMSDSTKELIKGRTPKLSGEGFLRPFLNTFGIIGDTINSAITYQNIDMLDKPVFGIYGGALNLIKEPFKEKGNVGKKLYDFQKSLNPLYNNLATKSIMRYYDEAVRNYIDPSGYRKYKGRMKEILKENNQVQLFGYKP